MRNEVGMTFAQERGHPFAAALPDLTAFDYALYERQLQLPGFGVEGQRRLKGAAAMVSRVGGLGGTVAMLLARAGIGRLVLAHGGVVEAENLNRMLLAFREQLGQTRMAAFCETLRRINPEMELITTAANVNAANVAALVAQADVVVDGAPLFEERYLMNEQAVRQGKPMVSAAMFGLESYVTTIIPGATVCLACIYPTPPHDWHLKAFPVIAPSSVFIATIATMEAIKVLTGAGEVLANRLLYCDLTTNSFRQLRVARRSNCPVCGYRETAVEWGGGRNGAVA
jgi:molybdopterin-synthase adenylyltransferase